jgi:SAM-dependent methyltransferase
MVNARISFIQSVRPEIIAGGIARDDGEIHFYTRVNALLRPEMTVVDYGCGRGGIFDSHEFLLREQLAKLQGKARKVIGIDVDKALFEHPFLDERHLVEKDAPLPIATASVDLIVAHWVFEHIEHPSQTSAEFFRILKPGGWICARTPNRWSYVGLAARAIPNGVQNMVIKWIKPGIDENDKFPTAYKLNSFSQLQRCFPKDKWLHFTYGMNSTPRYNFANRLIFAAMSAFQQATWPKTDLLVLIQKKQTPGSE